MLLPNALSRFFLARSYRLWLFMTIVILMGNASFASANDSIRQKLEKAITNRDHYIDQKHSRIAALKKQLGKHEYYEDNARIYSDCLALFKEYQSFQYDSAYFYLDKAKSKALVLKDTLKLSNARIKEGFVLMSSGLFKEAIDTLAGIDVERLPVSYKFEYYAVAARTYYDLADYTRDERFSANYIRMGNKYLQQALLHAQPNTNEYWNTECLRRLKNADWKGARDAYLYWIREYNLPPHYKAIAASSLAYVYSVLGDNRKNIDYLTVAAIADIESAIKETVAIRNLAAELFKLGDIKNANRYISIAMEDATFYNARHRKTELSSILPIIERAQIQKTESQKNTLTAIVIVLSILAILVVIFLVIIFKQLKARNASRQILAESNQKLQELNNNLKEADSIKQEYITYFLKVTSDILNKMDHLQKSTLQKIMTKRPDDVVQIIKKYSVKNERAHLFQQFDEVFLKLFPTFREDYNSLFPDKEITSLRSETALSNEMRIFALYRLGVQDSNQVADFLELSVATIYSYKTRVKSKSKYRDNFEEKIMEIRQI